MGTRTRIWWIWGFWVVLTFLPLLSAVVMVVFDLGFNVQVWLASLVVAILAFIKAQQAVERMRRLSNNLKIGRWLNSTKKQRDAARRDGDRERPGNDRTPTRRIRRIGSEKNQFQKRKFWKGLENDTAIRHVGDLFHLLGMSVTNAPNLDRGGTCLLLDSDTIVEVVESGVTAMPGDVMSFASYVDAKPSCRRGVMVAPHGFKRSVLQYADNTEVILLDAKDLSRLGQHLQDE